MIRGIYTELAKLMQNTKGRISVFLKSGYVIRNVYFNGYIGGLVSFIDSHNNITTLDISNVVGFKEET